MKKLTIERLVVYDVIDERAVIKYGRELKVDTAEGSLDPAHGARRRVCERKTAFKQGIEVADTVFRDTFILCEQRAVQIGYE